MRPLNSFPGGSELVCYQTSSAPMGWKAQSEGGCGAVQAGVGVGGWRERVRGKVMGNMDEGN
eukprot:759122-Hanusia_phi.AAC.1